MSVDDSTRRAETLSSVRLDKNPFDVCESLIRNLAERSCVDQDAAQFRLQRSGFCIHRQEPYFYGGWTIDTPLESDDFNE